MNSQNGSQDALANITTLEEAKQEISRLLEFQKKSYAFLNLFCNYDIKEPLLSAKGYAELLQQKERAENLPEFVKAVLDNQERIDRINEVVRYVVSNEAKMQSDGQEWLNRLKTQYPSESVVPNLILKKILPQVQASIKYQNWLYAPAKKASAKSKDETSYEAAELNIRFAEDMPKGQCNSSKLVEVLSDLVWFMVEMPTPKAEVCVWTDFDDQWSKIVIRCSTSHPHQYVFALEEFKKIETESTFFGFNPLSLFLYKSWQILKMYGGRLTYDVQDKTEVHEQSIAETTIWLRR